jgi:hypothetical protein
VTRDSLVDNMLLSLDQFSFGNEGSLFGGPVPEESQLYSGFGQEDGGYGYVPPRSARPGHGHSFSSDYENYESSSRTSSQLTRGRRSNSSSNFPTTSNRLTTSMSNQSIPAQRPPATQQNRAAHSRGGKGSKASSAGSSSFDLGYAQVTSNQRWVHGLAGRSSSFDYGHDRSAFTMQQGSSPTQQYDDYDAAPTPTVPVGPRRQMPMSPHSPYAESKSPPTKPAVLERKRSTRSSKGVYKTRPETHSGATPTMNTFDQSRNLPPLPAFKEPAPAPLVGYGKTKDAAATQTATPQTKPGFFRRVFGSSKNTAPTTGPTSSHGSTTSVENPDGPGSNKNGNSSQRTNTGHSTQPPPTPKEQPHILTKKPSSFFRRRKKSVSEPEVPALPAPIPQVLFHEGADLRYIMSPTSSLRQVMDPYLHSPRKSPSTPRMDMEDPYNHDNSDLEPNDVKGFSPGYTPDKNATIRSVNGPRQESRGGTLPRSGLSHGSLGYDGADSHSGYLSANQSRDDRSFLQDSSDTDREPNKISSQSLTVKDNLDREPHSPSTVQRDMALVAEYERVHSKRGAAKKAEAGKPPVLAQSPNGSKTFARDAVPTDDEVVRATPLQDLGKKENRIWLEPSTSEEDLRQSNLSLPFEGVKAPVSTSGCDTVYQSAVSLPITDDKNTTPKSPAAETASLEEKPVDNAKMPTIGDRDRAKKIYDGNEDFIRKSKAAAWLGEEGEVRQRTLVAYMELYDFKDLNILAALRMLCNRLVLKAETQQVDRIIDQFSTRWCQCNPKHGFKIVDVVHTICYSILLLNTDLHLADIESKMTRSQFVKNTIPTILRVISDAAPDAFEPNRPTILSPKFQAPEPEEVGTSKLGDDLPARTSIENERPSWRMSMRPNAGRANPDGQNLTPLNYATPVNDCGPLVKAPFRGTLHTWEVQVEIVLKDFYNSIRTECLPLFGAPAEKPQLLQASQSSLSVFASGVLRRTPSVISKAGSENQSSNRGRTAETTRLGTGKWTNKNRSRPRVYPHSTMGSSRTSLDDQSSVWSPSVSSSTWSKYSLGKTQTSMSVDSLGSNYPQGDYQQSIGFANALSQAIIREETNQSAGSNESEDLRVAPLLEDESLELAGAPWAKEGIVKHKHHLEAADKKAKDRNWAETFAVVEKGYMSLFSFSSKSVRKKSMGKAAGSVVGGGNWQDNAENLGSFLLRQTIASALPSPGYSKSRPHVFALSLPTGAVHLFQVGTPEIVREFVSTANYWSARLSNHPLVGGISNIEYGWSDAVINNSLVIAINENPTSAGRTSRTNSVSGNRPSLQSSLRSSLDHGTGQFRTKLPGDRIVISDWTPPTQSMRASNLMELDQLRTLDAYVKGIEEELMRHNQLRGPMLLAVRYPFPISVFSFLFPRSPPSYPTQESKLTGNSSHPANSTHTKQWQTGRRNLRTCSAR